MEFCLFCEKEGIIFGPIKIKVGKEFFKTKTNHCIYCKQVGISPKLQKKIDLWASQFSKSIIEIQPYFSIANLKSIESWAKHFGISKTEFIKLCTSFYLLTLADLPGFQSLRSIVQIENQETKKQSRKKVCIPIKYLLFKKIQLFAESWSIEYDSHVIEEAVFLCLFLLDQKNLIQMKKSQQIERIRELKRFFEHHAIAS